MSWVERFRKVTIGGGGGGVGQLIGTREYLFLREARCNVSMSFDLIELLRICVLISRTAPLPLPSKIFGDGRVLFNNLANTICFFCNSTGVFSNQDLADSPNHKETLHTSF